MNFWDRLGISPTFETVVIKRAYAKMLQVYHPEEDPEGFQLLREAYEQALIESKYIKELQQNQLELEPESVPDGQTAPSHQESMEFDIKTFAGDPASGLHREEISAQAYADCFMNHVEALYNNFAARRDLEQWRSLVLREEMWRLDIKELVNMRLLSFLTESYHLPKAVWTLLNENFAWTDQELELNKHFSSDFVDYLLMEVRKAWGLRYDFIPDDLPEVDTYLSHRNEAHFALIHNQLEHANHYLAAAQEIYADDPELLRLGAEFFGRSGDINQASIAVNRIIELEPANIDGFMHRANLAFRLGEIAQAFADYQYILSQNPNDLTALNGLARCYLAYDQPREAKSIWEHIIERYPFDLDARVSLLQANKLLLEVAMQELRESPGNETLRFSLAELYYDLEMWSECCQALESLHAANLRTSDLYLLWGRALWSQELIRESVDFYDQAWAVAMEEGVNGYDILVARGTAYVKLEEIQFGIRDLTAALQMNPNDIDVLYELSWAYYLEKDPEKGIELSTRAISLDPTFWGLYNVRSGCYFNLGQYRASIADDIKVLGHEFGFAYVWFRKGISHLYMEEYEEAAECLENALEWNYRKFAYYELAGARFLNQNYEGALEAIREYIRHFPEESRGYVLEGDIYRAIGNDAKATAIYCEAAEMFPEDYYSSKLALYMLLKQWDLEQMERIDASISRIMQQRPDDQWVLLETIKLLLNLKQWKPIPSIVQNYLMQRGEDDPYASLVWLYSGVAYYHMGNYQDSIKHLLRGYELGERNEVLVYLSAAYYKRGDLELAAAYAQLTCQQYPNESDYALYYEQIQQKLANSKKFLQAVFGRRNSAGITMPDKIYLDHQTVSKVCSLHFVVNGVEYIVE